MIVSNIEPKRENGPRYEAQISKEFRTILDPRMRGVAFDLSAWTWGEFHKHIIITCIGRTKKENKRVGGSKYSAHLYSDANWCRAWDVRIRTDKPSFTESEQQDIVNYLYDSHGRDFLFVLIHGFGANKHLHCNLQWNHTRRKP